MSSSDGRDPDGIADRLETLSRKLRSAAPGLELELYHRSSHAVRLTRRSDGETLEEGRDEGLALRTRSSRGGSAFAACSGLSMAAGRWALDRCRSDPGARRPELATWSADGRERVDREALDRLPAGGELAEWVDRATSELAGHRFRLVREMWVEVATTVESWVAERGYRASRSRTRGWAFARVRHPERSGRPPRPLLVAARRFGELDPRGFLEILEDRCDRGEREIEPPVGPVSVLFNPECSARLVLALTKSLHTGALEPGHPVGPAWRLDDDPTRDDALLGGSFDDAGFETRRKRLADGSHVVGVLSGEGHERRGSFRDRPAPQPSHLAILAESGEPPPCGVLVTGLGLHTLEPHRLVLEIDGASIENGYPGPPLKPAFIAADPAELVRRSVAAVGPLRRSRLGVSTPALVFEGLTVNGA